MKFFITLALLAMTEAGIITNEDACNGVMVRKIFHHKEILIKGIDRPYQLSLDFNTKTLFFSFSVRLNDTIKSESAYINLNTNEYYTIKGIDGGFASTVDTTSQSVYLGGTDGIYKFDYNTKTAKHVAAKEHNVWQMFYQNKLYYSTFVLEKVYTYKDGLITEVPELENTKAKLVAVDKTENIFFSNSSGLFCYMQVKDNIVKLGDFTVNGFALDVDGNLYFSTIEGIYFIKEANDTFIVDKVVILETVYGFAIEDGGDIIYSNEDSIVRLKPNKNMSVVGPEKNNNVKKN